MSETNRGPTGWLFTLQIEREMENMFYLLFYACIVKIIASNNALGRIDMREALLKRKRSK